MKDARAGMHIRWSWLGSRTPRTVATWATGLWLLVLQPDPVRVVEVAAARETRSARAPDALVLSAQAQRFLKLQYRSFPTEFMGCMIGEFRGGKVVVNRIAPADVDPARSAPTWVMPKQSCEEAGWAGTVGMIHSHVSGDRCWYFFPGTQMPSSDGQSFLHSDYPVDAIMCGDRVVWISREMVQKQIPLGERSRAEASGAPAVQHRGNLTQQAAGARLAGGD